MATDYGLLSDEALVTLAQSGDVSAEEEIINRYKGLVRSRAHLYFIVGADTEDVIQEGMIGMFKAIRSYRSEKEASFKTFAGLCINRQIITAIKAASRQKHGPLNNSISLSVPVDDSEGSETIENILIASESNPEELVLVQDIIDSIAETLPKILSKFEQQVWSAYLAGKNYHKIAEELGKTPKSIDNAIQRIKRKIAREYY